MIEIREERADDAPAVRAINEQAFDGPDEAALVRTLHEAGAVTLALVASNDAEIVGHILFSPVEIVPHAEGSAFPALALAPMSVLPARQRQGVGIRLVRAGLERLREAGHGAVIVLGHPEYYPRFGFVPASRFGVGCPIEVRDEAFMALELREGALRGPEGTVRYHPAFGL